jgi:hypothetical protein
MVLHPGQQIWCGETICAGVAFLLQFCQERGSHSHLHLDGHTHLTHGHMLCGELEPVCTGCGVFLTILLILAECPHYKEDCLHLYSTLHDMLGDDHHSMCNMLAFLNGIDLAKAI